MNKNNICSVCHNGVSINKFGCIEFQPQAWRRNKCVNCFHDVEFHLIKKCERCNHDSCICDGEGSLLKITSTKKNEVINEMNQESRNNSIKMSNDKIKSKITESNKLYVLGFESTETNGSELVDSDNSRKSSEDSRRSSELDFTSEDTGDTKTNKILRIATKKTNVESNSNEEESSTSENVEKRRSTFTKSKITKVEELKSLKMIPRKSSLDKSFVDDGSFFQGLKKKRDSKLEKSGEHELLEQLYYDKLNEKESKENKTLMETKAYLNMTDFWQLEEENPLNSQIFEQFLQDHKESEKKEDGVQWKQSANELLDLVTKLHSELQNMSPLKNLLLSLFPNESFIKQLLNNATIIENYLGILKEDFKKQIENIGSKDFSFGNTWTQLADFIKLYSPYVLEHSKAINLIQSSLGKIPNLKTDLLKLPKEKGFHLFNRPLNHPNELVKGLEKFLISTPIDNKEYELLKTAWKKMSQAVYYLKKKNTENQNIEIVLSISNKIVKSPKGFYLAEPHRRFVSEGEFVIEREVSKKKTINKEDKVTVVLFNDMIVFFDKDNEKYTFLFSVDISQVKVDAKAMTNNFIWLKLSSTGVHHSTSKKKFIKVRSDGSNRVKLVPLSSNSKTLKHIVREWKQVIFFLCRKTNVKSDTSGFEVKKPVTEKNKSGTFEEILFSYTDPYIETPDKEEAMAIILTHSIYTTSEKVLEYLFFRFNTSPSKSMDEKETKVFNLTILEVIRNRVFEFLNDWIENSPSDFTQNDGKISNLLKSYLSKLQPNGQVIQTQKKLLEKIVLDKQNQDPKNIQLISPRKKMDALTFLESIPPIEFAKQVSLFEFESYSKVDHHELLQQSWNKKNKANVAPNILKLIDFFNHFSRWVTFVIASQHSLKLRARLILKLTKIAHDCYKLNNLNTCVAIIAAFSSSPIRRLKKTWEKVGDMSLITELRELMDPKLNYKNYREHVSSFEKNTTSCPYLGIYLRDLIFLDEGNSTYVEEEKNIINFSKMKQLSGIISLIKGFQKQKYSFEKYPEIQQAFSELKCEHDEDAVFKLSLISEPRN